ncbi:hypothetical protein COT78_01825 [Candidatus Berkelbacteria bacterium CG10_big_fil_rev_8_21_14_0_10_43_13]|uniref:Dystroglycan-type cadherin-like domain-containing protein n=1 Tax=Candidatus Berkelbacteria bacterium CG10_big_fil_rev_8_21_14_0_10_43_13 TaxID=1974514 RepID=A0A2H0W6R4_9BACT|nr:MAG: hypothetical protein COT78_01825 [Candidatus Berkelbacteria bacterium CG10_big_fil_rev_8_21_14_0_10_43_13]
MVLNIRTKRIIGYGLEIAALVGFFIWTMNILGYFRIGADKIAQPTDSNSDLSENTRSYFKLFTLLHNGSRYTVDFTPDKMIWLGQHVDQATSQVAGSASSLQIPVNRYTNWRDFSTVDDSNISFTSLQAYYQARQQDVDNAFVHVASDTSFVRYIEPSRPLPSMNDRLQRVYTVSSTPDQAASLPDVTARQDVTHTAYGDQNVPTMPHDFTLTLNNTDTHYIVLGHPWKYDQLNFNVTTAATGGWQTNFEYWNGTAWLPLTTISDSTNNFSQSGMVHFAPPVNWSVAKLPGDDAAYYWLRFSEADMTKSVTFTAHKVLETNTNWDGIPAISLTPYAVSAYSMYRQNVIIPGWDVTNDTNHDGYVDDIEFANRSNKQASARFRYQSQLPASYLVGRWEANYADPTYQQFAADQARQLLSDTGTTRLFVDNGYTSLMLPSSLTLPTPDNPAPSPQYLEYNDDTAVHKSAVSFLTALRNSGANYILLNGALSQPITVPAIDGVMLENEITLSHSAQENPANLALFWSQLKTFSDAHKDVIVGATFGKDDRARTYNLARYYLTATPSTYFWTQSGASWSGWSEQMSRDLGDATGDYYLVATDTVQNTYIYRRDFTLGSVIIKTMAPGANTATGMGDDTKYSVDLGGRFYPVDFNNVVQPPISSISLRNYEGAILLKNQPPVWTNVEPQTIKVGETLKLKLPASDPEGEPLTFALAKQESGLSLTTEGSDTFLLFSPSSSQVGSLSITITASEGDQNSATTLEIVVTTQTNSGGEEPAQTQDPEVVVPIQNPKITVSNKKSKAQNSTTSTEEKKTNIFQKAASVISAIIPDIYKPDDKTSESVAQQTNDSMSSTILSRVSQKDNLIILISSVLFCTTGLFFLL